MRWMEGRVVVVGGGVFDFRKGRSSRVPSPAWSALARKGDSMSMSLSVNCSKSLAC